MRHLLEGVFADPSIAALMRRFDRARHSADGAPTT